MPSLAPNTAARNHPIRETRWLSECAWRRLISNPLITASRPTAAAMAFNIEARFRASLRGIASREDNHIIVGGGRHGWPFVSPLPAGSPMRREEPSHLRFGKIVAHPRDEERLDLVSPRNLGPLRASQHHQDRRPSVMMPQMLRRSPKQIDSPQALQNYRHSRRGRFWLTGPTACDRDPQAILMKSSRRRCLCQRVFWVCGRHNTSVR